MKKYLLLIVAFSASLLGKKPVLQEAKVFHDQNVTGWVMSEKLDGIRGYWDGRKLYTKNGFIIHAPKYFLDHFPPFALDGELWIGRGMYETIQSVVLDDTPSEKWKTVTYNIFEVPYAEGNFRQRLKKAYRWFMKHPNKFVKIIPQYDCHSRADLLKFLKRVVSQGGEGVIVKNPEPNYFTGRSDWVLKVKKYSDAEGKVLQINPGRGKYAGMMGSLTVQMKDGTVFKLGNGFTMKERLHPPVTGSVVTFKYYGWTKQHKPKFASFLHMRSVTTLEGEIE